MKLKNRLKILTKKIQKHFWLFNIVTATFLTFISSAFVTNLYFRMEDFSNLYFYFNGGNRPWPHYALKYILFIPHLIFSDQPMTHFVLVLILYILFSLSISFYIWEFTKNKTATFISIIIFSSGWVGSEMLFMVETGWYSLYYILSLFSVIFYYRYLNTQKLSNYLGSLSLFTLALFTMPFRAFSLIGLISLTHLFFAKAKITKSFVKLLFPFLIIHFFTFNILPKILGSTDTSLSFLTNYKYKYLPNLLSDFGNLVFPSTFQNLVNSKAVLLLLIIGLILFIKANIKIGKIIVYLSFCLFISYTVFHIKEYNLIHPSWSRYFMSPYPFYVFIAALIITTLTEKKHLKFKLLGFGLLLIIVSLNLVAGFYSPLKEKLLTRSGYLKRFNNDLIRSISPLDKNGRYLFYFDVTSNNKSQDIFTSFFESGIYPHEFVLADILKTKIENLKLARDYNEFSNELSNRDYSNKFTFYYSDDRKLLNTTSIFFSGSRYQLKDENIRYSSDITVDKAGSKSINNPLNIDIGNFPSVRPVKVTLQIKAGSLISSINHFPYREGSLYGQLPNEFSLLNIHNPDYLENLLKFIKERKELKTKLKITSSGSEYPDKIEDVVDSNDNTTWRSNKKMWRDGKPAWIEAEFPETIYLQEVRWISRRESNLPISYEYQVYSSDIHNWKSVFKVKDRKVKTNDYIIDDFPRTKTQKVRMLITETNGDFPAISEIEFLSNLYKVSSEQANFILKHPFTEIKDNFELIKIFNTVSNQLKISLYPISDKNPDKNHSFAVEQTLILDGQQREYAFILPPGGTKLTNLLIEFPGIPLAVNIPTISLSTLEK